MLIFKLHKRKMSRKSMGCHSIEGPKIKVLKKFFFTNLILFFYLSVSIPQFHTVLLFPILISEYIHFIHSNSFILFTHIHSFYSLTFIHFIHSHSSRFLLSSICNYSFIYSINSMSILFCKFIYSPFINSIIKPYINSFNIDFFYFLISFIISHFVYDFH